MNLCRQESAQAVYSAVLVEKQHDRKPALQRANFSGLEVEDRYVFGCGMDYKGYLRNIPGIHAVKGL
jgi:hypoxanthine phosphoribosyltransferase